MILHALTNLYMLGNKVVSAGMTKHSAAVHAKVVQCVRQPMAPRRQSPAGELWGAEHEVVSLMNLYNEAQWASFDWEYYRHTACLL